MSRQAIILAGGLGRRLQERLGDLPKPMIPIGGRPLLEIQIDLARRHGFTDIVIFACHRADLIQAHFGDGARFGVQLTYEIEATPLGTAGAVIAGHARLAEQFLVLYGDTLLEIDLDRLWRLHQSRGADATLLLHPNDHPLDSDLVEVNADGWITAFHNRPHAPERWFQNLVNAGLYVLNKSALQPWIGRPQPLDFGKDLFPALLERGAKLLGDNSPEYIKDIGTPARYDKVCAEFAADLPRRSGRQTPQPAVFLDRDGTLIREVDGLRTPEQLELLPGAAEAVHALNHHGFRVVVVTNQPVVAKGFCTESELAVIHRKLETLLGREHAFLDRIYFCPHHPERGFAGERPELKIDCACRKPKPGMIGQALAELNLDRTASWLIGDSTTDLETAHRAGLRSILVQTGHAGRDGKFPARSDHAFPDLRAAAQFVIEKARRLA